MFEETASSKQNPQQGGYSLEPILEPRNIQQPHPWAVYATTTVHRMANSARGLADCWDHWNYGMIEEPELQNPWRFGASALNSQSRMQASGARQVSTEQAQVA